jgi:hypothetical protein
VLKTENPIGNTLPLRALLYLLLCSRRLMKLSLEYFAGLLTNGLFNEQTGIPTFSTGEPLCFHAGLTSR